MRTMISPSEAREGSRGGQLIDSPAQYVDHPYLVLLMGERCRFASQSWYGGSYVVDDCFPQWGVCQEF